MKHHKLQVGTKLLIPLRNDLFMESSQDIFSLEVTQDFPDEYYPSRGMFVKQAIDAVAQQPDVTVEVVSPRAYVLPFRWFPHHNFSKLPRKKKGEHYTVHYPRYIYPMPKRFLYRFAAPSYGHFVKKYMRRAGFDAGKNTGKDTGSKPDVMHVHFPYPDAAGVWGMAGEWNIPLICHVRGGFRVATGKPYGSVEPKLLEALHAAHHVIAVSEDTREEYIGKGIPGDRISVVPNGVDQDRFHPIPMKEARQRCGLPGPGEKEIILFAGYLTYRKGIDRLVEVLPDIFMEHRNAMLVIMGEGPLERRLRRKVKEQGFTDRVLFRKNIPHGEMPYWENAADVVVLPSLAEGRPNVVIEAMACGRPVVSTTVSGIPELMQTGISGILIPPRENVSLVEAVGEVLSDPAYGSHLGTNALLRLRDMGLTWENCGKMTVEIYRRAIEEFGRESE